MRSLWAPKASLLPGLQPLSHALNLPFGPGFIDVF